ncbi:hypothetical protein BOTNAR_0266g00070 [Botryotinia narcissicola]|uniref:Uncharacterized protein n=1 Tax=Botryotinia narcissicola TaxID=278944 RepID=A0A4Z1ICE6_9HELO|nr:hypothetical protein BOTNAR_0266g00070 [Botryotinia narcissicola]
MSMTLLDIAMTEASSKSSGSSHRENDNEKRGFPQENTNQGGKSNSCTLDCEKDGEKVHEEPAKELMFSIFEFPNSEPKLNAQEKKIEKEKKKEIERKIKENEKVEKEKMENERKMEKKIKDEEKRIAKEKKREMEKMIQEAKKREKERINIAKKKVKAEYKRWQKENDWKRAEARRVDAEHVRLYHSSRDSQAYSDDQMRMEHEWRCHDARAKYEKDLRIEQLKSKLKALDLQLTMSGEEVLRLYQLKAEDEISKEQARERLRTSIQAENSVAQPRQTGQSNEEELTKKFTSPVFSQEINSSMEDNPFYAPGEFKYHKMGEWDSDTCKEWIYDSLEDGLTGFELQQLCCQLRKMPRIRGKEMFGATEEKWVKWLDIQGLLIHDKLQKIAEVKVDM